MKKILHIKYMLFISVVYLLTACGSDGENGASSLVNLLDEGVALQSPIANAGPDQSVFLGDTVTFDGSASSDADGQIVSYVWTIPAIGTKEGISVTETLPDTLVEGTYTVTLKVTDNDNKTDEDSLILTVSSDGNNTPPKANDVKSFFDTCITTPISIVLDGSDADGDPLVYRIVEQPRFGTATINNNVAIYVNTTDCKNEQGEVLDSVVESFIYRVNDGKVDSNDASVRLTFGIVNI
jgi:hypothetical protein